MAERDGGDGGGSDRDRDIEQRDAHQYRIGARRPAA
jgi:hypothetical protein